jgi:Group II intron, maturase-specific domain
VDIPARPGSSDESGRSREGPSVSIERTIEELAPYMRGWRSYFGFCETPGVLNSGNGHGKGREPLRTWETITAGGAVAFKAVERRSRGASGTGTSDPAAA